VAVKVLAPAFACSPRGRARFRAEARALAKVCHPNVVQIHDVVEEGPVCAGVMEWVEGLSLARLLDLLRPLGAEATSADVAHAFGEPLPARPGPFTVVACRLAIAVGRALGAVHHAGLVNRDVKPSNFLVRKDGTPLLSDFGLAWDPEVSLGTETGAFVGTAAFAAPEQLRGTGVAATAEPDARADIYGLGASLYAGLAGRPPSEGRSSAGVGAQGDGAALAGDFHHALGD
jgi:serine/threonine-protein kinase